jgi:murein DD-endopeptidase MepM/ murein hydrolase activator NlpD
MQVIFNADGASRTHVLQVSRWQVVLATLLLVLSLMLVSGTVYHVVFLKAAREGWPVVSQIVGLVLRDEVAQRDRFMRENLDAMAQKVGEMQAKLIKLEAMGERVSGLAGVKPDELKLLQRSGAGGRGGPYVPPPVAGAGLSMSQLTDLVVRLDAAAEQDTDLFTLFESRLLESRLQVLMIPSTAPLEGPVGSGFGFRNDPFTGQPALHMGLDFPAETGAAIHAAAAGLVVVREWHPAYGQVLEIDHGNGLTTRYAHASSIDVAQGALVKRGQVVARVGTSGRSTGPHLHFEVLVDGVPQDPARFLAGSTSAAGGAADKALAKGGVGSASTLRTNKR